MTETEVIRSAERRKRGKLTPKERRAVISQNKHSPRVICATVGLRGRRRKRKDLGSALGRRTRRLPSAHKFRR